MKSLTLSATVAATFAAVLAGTAVQAADTAQYEVRIDATWTDKSHPLQYPGNAHFSGLIGTTHGNEYRIFVDGGQATPGLEALSERGAHSPLDSEIKQAVSDGVAGGLFESAPLFEFPGTISATFTANATHPNVSVVAMVAPSPDWFTGASNIALKTGDDWVDQVTYTLFAWDAGTDGGDTYAAVDADMMPRQSIRLNAAPHFKSNDGLKPVGTVTFTRIEKTASN